MPHSRIMLGARRLVATAITGRIGKGKVFVGASAAGMCAAYTAYASTAQCESKKSPPRFAFLLLKDHPYGREASTALCLELSTPFVTHLRPLLPADAPADAL